MDGIDEEPEKTEAELMEEKLGKPFLDKVKSGKPIKMLINDHIAQHDGLAIHARMAFLRQKNYTLTNVAEIADKQKVMVFAPPEKKILYDAQGNKITQALKDGLVSLVKATSTMN